MLEYAFKFYNLKTSKVITKRATGSSRAKAFLYLLEKIREPKNLVLITASSAI